MTSGAKEIRMADDSSLDAKTLHGSVAAALEGARAEVIRRLTTHGIPLTIEAPELRIVPTTEGGWRSEWAVVPISPLHNISVEIAIKDDSIPHRILGLRSQLEALARLLDERSDLGSRPANLLPGLSGVDAILARYLTNLARTYLLALSNLEHPEPATVTRLAEELGELIQQTTARRTYQLAIEGLHVQSPLEHRGVRLRQLTPAERGRYYQSRSGDELNPYQQPTDFVIPREFTMITPSTLLEVTTNRPIHEVNDQTTLPNRVALAFFLKDFVIASTGIVVAFDRPIWATFGQSHGRSLVGERPITTVTKPITQAEFEAVVDLAHKIPEFGPEEASNHEVALYRTLRGLGVHWQESGFLDFAIALEAALLQGPQTELAYKFALYGALFLRDERPTEQTFEQLRNVYDVRSKLVHGSPIKAERRAQAMVDAADIEDFATFEGGLRE
jgi:hypothetical protein